MSADIETQKIEESEVGSAEEILDLGKETAESVDPTPTDEVKEEVVEIECGKLEGTIKSKFVNIYRLLEPLATKIDHSPASFRHHFKGGEKSNRGFAVLFYSGKTPKLVVNHDNKGMLCRETLKITTKGLINEDGEIITQKTVLKSIREFRKVRNL